jgi:hypothetical protein
MNELTGSIPAFPNWTLCQGFYSLGNFLFAILYLASKPAETQVDSEPCLENAIH